MVCYVNQGNSTSLKLRIAGISLMQWVMKTAHVQRLAPVGQVLLDGLMNLIREPAESQTDMLRGFSYESVGLLSKKRIVI
jgi:hypothetical protein